MESHPRLRPNLLCFIIPTLFISIGAEQAKASFKPDAIVLRLFKEPDTLHYYTFIDQRTPSVRLPLVVDLGGELPLWVDCETEFKSKSYKVIKCGTTPCSLAKSESCGGCFEGPKRQCYNNSCDVLVNNPVTDTSTTGVLTHDVVSLQSFSVNKSGHSSFLQVKLPNFLIACAPSFMHKGIEASKGMIGLGRTRVSLPSLLAATFNYRRSFVTCLSHNGAVLFGDYSNFFTFEKGYILDSFTYTPLIKNPVTSVRSHLPGYPSSEYYIGLKSIKINGRRLNINSTLLEIDSNGNGGTKLSTMTPYTLMHTSIYKSFIASFRNELTYTQPVSPVSPFELCYETAKLGSTRAGVKVPKIDFYMKGGRNKYWRFFGLNSMIAITDKVMCLAILDGGLNMRSSIVIGGYQMENYLLQFDLAASRFGFSSSLLLQETSCTSFKYEPYP